MEERLQKILSRCGFGSRRACEEMITMGRITVNGNVAELGSKADPKKDVIRVDGSILQYTEPEKVYIMLNKPRFVLSDRDSSDPRRSVFSIVENSDGLFVVGRLDFESEGLILLTNDGELSNKLMHPSNEFSKRYVVRVQGIVTRAEAAKLEKGVDIGGFVTSPADVHLLKHDRNSTVAEIVIHEGKNRQVRRMFKAIGHPVLELCRTGLGNLEIGRLAVGQCRKLSPAEVEQLKRV